MNQFSVKARLVVLVVLLSIVMVAVGFIGLNGMATTKDRLKTVYEDRTICLVQLFRVMDATQSIRGQVLAAQLASEQAKAASALEAIPQHLAIINKEWTDYRATYLTPEEKSLADKYEENFKRFKSAVDLVRANASGDSAHIAQLVQQSGLNDSFRDTRETLQKLAEYQSGVAKTEYEAANSDYRLSQGLGIGSLVFGLVVGSLIAFWITSSIVNPLKRAVRAAQRIASGDLSVPAEQGGRDEVGQLQDALAHMQDELVGMAGQIRHGVDDLAISAGQLAEASSEVAHASNVQSRASSTISSAVEELTVSIGNINERVSVTRQLCLDAGSSSDQGAQVSDQALAGMQQISATVHRSATDLEDLNDKINCVSSVVEVIKGVAEQTNLLALNAAIEAARAGDQGRGFAVVADEVRRLSERTSGSTEEITKMIGQILEGTRQAVHSMKESVGMVHGGVALVAETGQAMQQIKNSAGSVVEAVNDIALALHEQSVASQDIARQVELIAQSIEENAAAIMQTADSSKELDALGRSLSASTGQFKLPNQTAHASGREPQPFSQDNRLQTPRDFVVAGAA